MLSNLKHEYCRGSPVSNTVGYRTASTVLMLVTPRERPNDWSVPVNRGQKFERRGVSKLDSAGSKYF